MPERLPSAEALFEDAACGLVVTTEDGTILRANQVFCTWVGRSEAQLDGVRFQSLLTMGGRIFHQTHWAPLIQMQGSVAEVKLDLLHRDGKVVTMLLNGVRREHSSGAYHELALFGTTDRDRYERELLAARQRAEELLQEKTAAEAALQHAKIELSIAYEKSQRRAVFAEQMVAIASHDLKNPLTAINMAANFLARGERSAREAQMLEHISRSAERAQRMIADLLDFALARVGPGLAVVPGPLDVHPLIAQSVSELRVAFPAATLIHRFCGEGQAELDADRIHQLIGNLVANSVAYGSALQPITITSAMAHDATTLSVHNHGPAIPEALTASLFEPMTRGSLKDDSVRSVGLGLYIVREIAKAHGGDVTVSSSEAAGTTFVVRLPRVGVGS